MHRDKFYQYYSWTLSVITEARPRHLSYAYSISSSQLNRPHFFQSPIFAGSRYLLIFVITIPAWIVSETGRRPIPMFSVPSASPAHLQEVHKIIWCKGWKTVRVLGLVSRNEIRIIWRRCFVFIEPSRKEQIFSGWPLPFCLYTSFLKSFLMAAISGYLLKIRYISVPEYDQCDQASFLRWILPVLQHMLWIKVSNNYHIGGSRWMRFWFGTVTGLIKGQQHFSCKSYKCPKRIRRIFEINIIPFFCNCICLILRGSVTSQISGS